MQSLEDGFPRFRVRQELARKAVEEKALPLYCVGLNVHKKSISYSVRLRACGRHLLEKRVLALLTFALSRHLTASYHPLLARCAGIAYAVVRLYQATAVDAFREGARKDAPMSELFTMRMRETGRASDIPEGKPVFSCSWCNGARELRWDGLNAHDSQYSATADVHS